jgi:hypothetical protein
MNEGPELSLTGPQNFNRFVHSLLPVFCFLFPIWIPVRPALCAPAHGQRPDRSN